MTVQYITIEQAIETHQKTIQYSGGGANGLLNKGQLESVLEHIKMMTIIQRLLIN